MKGEDDEERQRGYKHRKNIEIDCDGIRLRCQVKREKEERKIRGERKHVCTVAS